MKNLKKVMVIVSLCAGQLCNAETVTKTSETIKDGIVTKVTDSTKKLISHGGNTSNVHTEISTHNGVIIRKFQSSSRIDKDGIFLEEGTTIEIFKKSGLLKQRDHVHNESYKKAMSYKRQFYDYTLDGKLKKVQTLSFRTSLLQSLNFTSEFYPSGKVKETSEPILKGSILVGKMITNYNYNSEGKKKEVMVCKYGNDSHLIEKKIYNYDNTGSLIND